MKLAVVGSRSFSDKTMLTNILDQQQNISCIISGGARGVDTLAEQWARSKNVETKIFLPDWLSYGRAAGPIRNRNIIEACDECVAFWDGESPGTRSSIELCNKLGKPIKIVII